MVELVSAPMAPRSAPRWLRRLPAPAAPDGWRVLRRAAGEAAATPLADDLESLLRRLDAPGITWIAALGGPRAEVAYLADVLTSLDAAAGWAPASGAIEGVAGVVLLPPASPALRSAVLLGEGTARVVLLLLLVEEPARELAVERLRTGSARAAVASAQLALAYRVGGGWAAAWWPGSAPPAGARILERNGVTRPPGARHPASAAAVGVALLATAAVLTLARSGSGSPGATPSASGSSPSAEARPSGPAPSGRQLAASAYDADAGVSVVFGGITADGSGTVLGDTWIWNGGGWAAWQPSPPASGTTGAARPAPRFAALMAYAPPLHGVVLFGGTSRGATSIPFQDTWLWRDGGWTPLDVKGPPDGRAVALAYDRDAAQLTLVTAPTAAGLPMRTWTWSPGLVSWSSHDTALTPDVRLMSADPAGGHIVALTASAGPAVERTWRWDGRGWTLLHPTSDVVVETLSATLAADLADGTLVLVEERFIAQDGGAGGGTWTWDGSTWSQHAGPVPDIVHAFDVSQPVWFFRAGDLALVGGPREGPTYDESWSWDGAVWSQTGGARSGAP